MKHLYVIAGHGAGDCGAVGNGFTEAERVRTLAARIGQLGGVNVTLGDMSRNYYADNGISRLNIPKDWAIIELHMDSGASSKRGGHVIVCSGLKADEYDKLLANFIAGILPGRSSRIVARNNLANPERAKNKGYNYRLLECGFISNATDVSIFNSRIDDIARGILAAFGIECKKTEEAKWIKNDVGWWYRYPDGTYPKAQWLKLDTWYYFNEKGYALCEQWIKHNGKWYYLKKDCRMATGWQKVEGYWYYLGENGAMLDGWQKVKGKWYYLNKGEKDIPHGAMITGDFQDEDYEYLLSDSGAMITGWVEKEGKRFYYNENKNCQPIGSMMRNHWEGSRYLKDDGCMAHNETLEIGGKKYTF